MKKEKTRMTIVAVQRVPNVYGDGYYYMARTIIKESTGRIWLERSHSRSKINLLTDKEASDFFANSVYQKTFEGEKFTELAGLFAALEDLVEKYKEQKSESNKAIKYFIFAKEVK